MLLAKTIKEVRNILRSQQKNGLRTGFVPTMGALHDGHMELVRTAKRECGFVTVSIFVNPIQFGPGEDFHQYPRPIEADLEKCRREGVDLVFNPAPEEMYPAPQFTTVQVGKLTESLCGEFRPGHFTGVTTVVAKLFNIVQPDAAYFGQKDAQQALVIRRMVKDLDFPVEIRVCPTVRGEGGLALSSRNQYLSESERTQATCLYQSFGQARRMLKDGVRETSALIRAMKKHIESAGPCEIQYLRVVDLDTIKEVGAVDRPVLIALAVKVGPARLIDNIIVDSDGNEIIMADLK